MALQSSFISSRVAFLALALIGSASAADDVNPVSRKAYDCLQVNEKVALSRDGVNYDLVYRFFSLPPIDGTRYRSHVYNIVIRFLPDRNFWDIHELRERFPISSWAGSGLFSDGTGGEQLVTVEGQVHRLYSINYALWGKMFLLCHHWEKRPNLFSSNPTDILFTENMAVMYTRTYKTVYQKAGRRDHGRSPLNIEEAVAFVRYGYSRKLPTDDFVAKDVAPSALKYPDGVMDYVWAPYITEKRKRRK